ncbi:MULTISPECIES: GNAT family N-acetyltransferase [Methanobacterium]|jgi:ribosomal protein S18 acetylase RimI-like enzyme|uniref:GNAT family N-acetyltransferase n=1 Tax=Methanobacterium veterum TaxID=408577 RepID=A0A9E5DMK3_9EURY|nr:MULTISPECIES: GNAT family N-acetyltransferase [Methanobacterium]MCZ3365907.1 GNAT family N-acetyltransferase [Methanobacterium veterum]MCZ3371372.1 GNAT family N-acetyltransferase [Methanobacterium veterum]
MDISYVELEKDSINLIKPLWERLRDHHRELSPYFPERYVEFTFQERKEDLLKKSENGILRIDTAYNETSKQFIGYCISSISDEKIGEVDSIYLDDKYRSSGIGDTLMKRSLNWMNQNGVETKRIMVAAGNENTLAFYSRYNFFPKHIILEQSNK